MRWFKSWLFGVLYGVGGIAFGEAIRFVGYSCTYAVARSGFRAFWAPPAFRCSPDHLGLLVLSSKARPVV